MTERETAADKNAKVGDMELRHLHALTSSWTPQSEDEGGADVSLDRSDGELTTNAESSADDWDGEDMYDDEDMYDTDPDQVYTDPEQGGEELTQTLNDQ